MFPAFLWIGALLAVAAFVAATTNNMTVVAVLSGLLALLAFPLAGLGCWRCNYNLFRRYGGRQSVEHGDSWTTGPLYPWRMVPIPEDCPKCGAPILSALSATQSENPQDA
jgi:hypothetical protein